MLANAYSQKTAVQVEAQELPNKGGGESATPMSGKICQGYTCRMLSGRSHTNKVADVRIAALTCETFEIWKVDQQATPTTRHVPILNNHVGQTPQRQHDVQVRAPLMSAVRAIHIVSKELGRE